MHTPSMGLAGGLHMHLCGAPVDTARRLADLAEIPLDQYRLIVVDGLCALSESEFAAIRAHPAGRTVDCPLCVRCGGQGRAV